MTHAPDRCPACIRPNHCGLLDAASGENTCWCFSVTVAPEILDRLPPAAKDSACLCQRCAADRTGVDEIS